MGGARSRKHAARHEFVTWRRLLAVLAFALASPVWSAVEGLEVTERVPFASGMSFGESGSYEKIRGVAHFALDPAAPRNAGIVDLGRAPHDADGKVRFASEFLLLRPTGGESTLIYDVNNRGNIAILGQLNGRVPAHNDPTTAADAGDGFLMRHGFSLLFSAWTWDVAPQGPADRPLVFSPPVAFGPHGQSIFGKVENEFTVPSPTKVAVYAGMRGLTYEPAIADDPRATLTERALPHDPRRLISRAKWRFSPPSQPGGPGQVELEGGFQAGVLYELIYTAKDPKVTGAGLAGIRDLLAYFRTQGIEGAPPPRAQLIFGISQSARLIGRMLHDGLDVSEEGALVFDGAYLEVPGGGGSSGFNSRFVQPTRHPSLLEEHDYPSDAFPFTSAPSHDPVTGKTASTLDHARDLEGRLPKIMIANTSTEYWNRDASLVTTSPDGRRDVDPAGNVRVYAFLGAQHYVGRSHGRDPFMNCVSTTDHYLPMRSLLLALQRWTVANVEPPESAVPRISNGTLISVDEYRARFPQRIGITPPSLNLREPRLDFGPRFSSDGIASRVPPAQGPRFATLVPAPDADGNDRGGVRMIELEVPLGTHTGWNLRDPKTGFGWAPARFDGSFSAFPRTRAEAPDDPRATLAERYPDRATLEARLREAADGQKAAGFLLEEDVERAVTESLELYDRIMARDPASPSCEYLFP
jgi:Alpha/beta hydrolase domain